MSGIGSTLKRLSTAAAARSTLISAPIASPSAAARIAGAIGSRLRPVAGRKQIDRDAVDPARDHADEFSLQIVNDGVEAEPDDGDGDGQSR
ncbi:hypothetical protein [Methylocella sp.]|uniref:hypothetical protein n=1 Tax=Methylocella sp. TaxID=1978226 RepID=UPI003783A805